jgi:multidrug efflux pump subunit AcrB
MPGLFGLDTLKAVRPKSPQSLVIMLAAYGTVQDAVDAMKLGACVKIRLLDDASTFVKDAIADVVHEMATAGALVGLIVLLLLGSWRATAIVWTSIPLSILTALIGLHLLGESINIMTLGGLALAVGVLVDNAIVTIENIDRHIEMGKPLETAIIDAAGQIVVPTFVSMLAIAIVWFPLFKLGGVAGYLFRPMAEAFIFAMLASFVLSFTLLPTMAKYMMTSHHHEESPHTTDAGLLRPVTHAGADDGEIYAEESPTVKGLYGGHCTAEPV